MTEPLSRRDALKQLGAAGASVILGPRFIRGQAADIIVAGAPVEIVRALRRMDEGEPSLGGHVQRLSHAA